MFAGRLMFPVSDRIGRVLGFGARKLDEAQPGGKYINSPNGPLYSKGCTLYAAPDVREAAAEQGYIVVVEGYVDAIALRGRGWRHVAAVMGTAFSKQQALELAGLAEVAVLAFDADTAGETAASAAAATDAVRTTCVHLPPGLDPADLVATPEGLQAWTDAVTESLSLLAQAGVAS